MNKFDLKLLQREVSHLNIINAFCVPHSEGVFELFFIFKINDSPFCSFYGSTFEGDADRFKLPFLSLKNISNITITHDIQTIENTFLNDVKIESSNDLSKTYVISRFVSNLSKALFYSGIINDISEVKSSNIFEFVRSLDEISDPLTIYKKTIEKFAMPFLELESFDLSKLELTKEES